MSSRRFELLLKFLHLNDSRKQPARGQPEYDKLYKVRPFLDAVVKNFQACYTPSENLSIDESMVGFKGRLAFLQYMPKKPQKWGMKAWVLADSSSGYIWNWKLYTGKDVDMPPSPLGLAHRVVLELLDDDRLRSKGYRVFTDNFYSSPDLFKDLQEEGFEACGTLRSNRKGIPDDVRGAKLRKGESHFSQDDTLLFMKWKDKRDVLMLSTFHDDTFIEKRRRTRLAADGVEVIQKPSVVEDYNQHMGGVDKGKKCNECTLKTTYHLFSFSRSAGPLLWICAPLHQVVEASIFPSPRYSDRERSHPVQRVHQLQADSAAVQDSVGGGPS